MHMRVKGYKATGPLVNEEVSTMPIAPVGECTCENEDNHIVVSVSEWIGNEIEGVRVFCKSCNHTWIDI